MRFAVLGPVRAWSDEAEVSLGSPQQRAVLAVLLLRRGRPVGMTELINAVWGEEQPSDPAALVRTYVSRLRKVLEPVRRPGEPPRLLISVADGYVANVPEGDLDLSVFEVRLTEARRLSTEGHLAEASQLLRDALSAWDSTPLTGVPGPLAAQERTRLLERHLRATEIRLSIDLALGRHEDVVDELASMLALHPLREQISELLMLALYRCGRQAEALETYQLTRHTLIEKLGVEPGPSLQNLHDRLLRADDSLAPPAPRTVPDTARGRQSVQEADPREDTAGGLAAADSSASAPSEGPRLDTKGSSLPRPAQLPAALGVFAGRAAELVTAEAMLRHERRPSALVVGGMAGVGKTGFAVHLAHHVAHLFPDGQLFVDLRGTRSDGTALETADVLRIFLDGLGVPRHQVPADPHAQLALYRSLLAVRRVLIVLDDARDAQQVRALLPGSSECCAIVTSRARLQGLVANQGARPLHLGLMSREEARELLVRRIGVDRSGREPGALDDVIDLCGRLPLALAVVATRTAMHPRFPLAAIVTDLRENQGNLDAFAQSDETVDVRSAFSCSYALLSPAARTLFHLLSLHPGPEITAPAAASLAGMTVRDVRSLLAELSHGHLIMESAPGRFAFHELLRAYASELAHECETPSDRRQATRRILDHFLSSIFQASALLDPPRETVQPLEFSPVVQAESFADRRRALKWLRREYPTLCAAAVHAGRAGFPDHARWLAHALENHLEVLGL